MNSIRPWGQFIPTPMWNAAQCALFEASCATRPLPSNSGPQPRLERTLKIFDDINQMTLEAAERVTRIVQSLKSFARLDQPELEWVDLHEGIESTLTLMEHLIKERIQVVKNYGELPKVKCYASQINQVFANVLTNAVQAIDGDGQRYNNDGTGQVGRRDPGGRHRRRDQAGASGAHLRPGIHNQRRGRGDGSGTVDHLSHHGKPSGIDTRREPARKRDDASPCACQSQPARSWEHGRLVRLFFGAVRPSGIFSRDHGGSHSQVCANSTGQRWRARCS